MTRPLFLAALLALPAMPALAADPAGHGALAGRSPTHTYRVAATTPACGKVMHSQPGGKLPTYGLHALSGAPCEAPALAVASSEPSNERQQGE